MHPHDRAILEAHSLAWNFPGARDSMLAEETGLTPTQQAHRLVRLVDDPEAMREYPVTCRLLRQLRDRRKRSRSIRA